MAFSDIDLFYNELGLRIKTQRLALNITQEALAQELELTRASIINLENGRHKPSIYQIVLIAKYFNTDYTKLIPMPTELVVEKEKKTVPDLSNMVSDQDEIDSPSKQAILDFLSSVKNK
jgi:transcriptional regulator with XRE-family HTH domain